MYEGEGAEAALCGQCGQVLADHKDTVHPALLKYVEWRIDDVNKFLRLNGAIYSKPIETRVKMVGSSQGFILPKPLMDYLGLEAGDPVKLIIIPDPDRD